MSDHATSAAEENSSASYNDGTAEAPSGMSAVVKKKRKEEEGRMGEEAQTGSSLTTGTKMSDHIISAAKGTCSALYSVSKVVAASTLSVVAKSGSAVYSVGTVAAASGQSVVAASGSASYNAGTEEAASGESAVVKSKRKEEEGRMGEEAQTGSSLTTGTKMSDHIISAAKGTCSALYSISKVVAASTLSVVVKSCSALYSVSKVVAASTLSVVAKSGSAVYSVCKVAAASGRSVEAASLPYLRITGKKTTTYSSFASEGTDQLGSAACPVVVRPHKDANNFELRDENLLLLLTNSDVADLPVVVLSVAGGFRLGKSFLLGFCIRYLKHLEMSSDRSDWMDEENIPLTGFSWKYGSERETTGIQLWGKVFKIMTRQHGLVAVVLMDTECSFDNRFTMEGNVTVFSLSMLLSSVQVYNLTKQITQSDLEHLKLFTEYASMARSAGGRDKEVFQKLLFLIRDWQYPGEKSFGLEGGEALLQPFLQRDPTLQNEVSELRENIRNSFSEVKCFLMPRPGDAVENTEFDGKLRDISRDCKYHLKNLLSYLLSPERLVPKKINGRIVTCEELVCMFQAYFTVFNEKELPQPRSVFNATAFVHNKRINDEIVKKYETAMEGVSHLLIYFSHRNIFLSTT
ncbi:atlastin-2-like [Ornithodoros turicata]|uniref:atlastin-2-like n=1 Tax=Ornithodoros turicata TaxID=34597 RepID=UPI003139F5DE